MKHSQLNMGNAFALGRYLGTIEERLKTEGPTYHQVAEWSTKELGFTVSPTNVKSVAESAKIEWDIKQRGSGGNITKLKGRLGDVEAELTQAKADIAQLRGLVHHLYKEMGAQPPPGLAIPVTSNCRVVQPK